MRLRRRRPAVMGFWDHVGELRNRILWSLAAVAAGTVAGLIVYDWLLASVFLPPYCNVLAAHEIERPCSLVITTPLEGFRTRIKVSMYLGVVLAMPVLLWHLWRFITPALRPRERRWTLPFVSAAFVLFAAGALLAYFTFERALDFLVAVSGDVVDPLLGPGSYLGLVTFMMLVFGLAFEFPIVLVFAQITGIVTPQRLRRARRYAIVGIVAGAAIITPSGDPITLAALSVPLYAFYELSILIGSLLARRRSGEPPSRRRRPRSSDSPEPADSASVPTA